MSEFAGAATAGGGGDEAHMQSFEAAWAQHGPAVVGVIGQKVGWDKDLVQELVQCTALKALEGWRRGHPPHTNTEGWLKEIARNVFNDYCRRKKRQQKVVGGGEELPAGSEAVIFNGEDSVESRELVHPCLTKLDDLNRQIVVARHYFDCTIEEICRQVGLSESSVRGRLYRAKAELKACLASRGYHNG